MDSRTRALYASVADNARLQPEAVEGHSGDATIDRKPVPISKDSFYRSRAPPTTVKSVRRRSEHDDNVESGRLVDERNAYNLYEMAAALPDQPQAKTREIPSPKVDKAEPETTSIDAEGKGQPLGQHWSQKARRMIEGRLQSAHQRKTSTNSSNESCADDKLNQSPRSGLRDGTSSKQRHRDRQQTENPAEHATDTITSTRYSPAVMHETVQEDVHEVQHHRIVQDIHQHHIYHRILPVHEVEVLPAVHYVSDGRSTRRLHAQQIAEPLFPGLEAKLKTAFENTLPKDSSAPSRRRFTARGFQDGEGDPKTEVTPDGKVQTERWWVHAPEIETRPLDYERARSIVID